MVTPHSVDARNLRRAEAPPARPLSPGLSLAPPAASPARPLRRTVRLAFGRRPTRWRREGGSRRRRRRNPLKRVWEGKWTNRPRYGSIDELAWSAWSRRLGSVARSRRSFHNVRLRGLASPLAGVCTFNFERNDKNNRGGIKRRSKKASSKWLRGGKKMKVRPLPNTTEGDRRDERAGRKAGTQWR